MGVEHARYGHRVYGSCGYSSQDGKYEHHDQVIIVEENGLFLLEVGVELLEEVAADEAQLDYGHADVSVLQVFVQAGSGTVVSDGEAQEYD